MLLRVYAKSGQKKIYKPHRLLMNSFPIPLNKNIDKIMTDVKVTTYKDI